MRLQVEQLGKASITVEQDYWNINKDYDKLTVVEKQGVFGTYLSRIPVPAGIELTNRKYWIPFSSLKEEIVLDYAEFINRFSGVIDELRGTFSTNEERLIALERLKDLTTTLTRKADEAISTSKANMKTADDAIKSANEATAAAREAINNAKSIQKSANDAVLIATDASNDAKNSVKTAQNTLRQAEEANNNANQAVNLAQEAVNNSNKAICTANNYFKLAQALKKEVDKTYEDVKEQDEKVKLLYCDIVKLHDHVKERLEIINRDIASINESIAIQNSSIREIMKEQEKHDCILRNHKERLDNHKQILDGHKATLDNHEARITNNEKLDEVQAEHLKLHDERLDATKERMDIFDNQVKFLQDSKVDKVEGKGLSTNDFTNAFKTKLEGLFNYDDTELRTNLNNLTESFNTLVEGNPTEAIENFNEIIAFLENIEDSETLEGIVAAIQSQIADINILINSQNNANQSKFEQIDNKLNDLDDTDEALRTDLTTLETKVTNGNNENKTKFDSIDTKIQNLQDTKVNKVEGKGLSTNDFTDTQKDKLNALPTASELKNDLNSKVNAEDGKTLSSNDYTNEEKTKLSQLPTKAQLDSSLDTKVTKVNGKDLSTNDYDDASKANVDSIPEVMSEISRIVTLKKNNIIQIESTDNVQIRITLNCNRTINGSNWDEGIVILHDLTSDTNNIINVADTIDAKNINHLAIMFDGNYSNVKQSIKKIDLSKFKVYNVYTFFQTFTGCKRVEEIIFPNLIYTKSSNEVLSLYGVFLGCLHLKKLDISSLKLNLFDNPISIDNYNIFYDCIRLNYIRCTQIFKDWCIENKDYIKLPTAMQEGGSGIWEIVD